MNILAAVVVQIIGLAVLRDEPELGGMHVVLPTAMASSDVEPHSPILVFRNVDRVNDGNDWPYFPLEPMPGYSYVKLKGERIRFIVNGNNAPAEIPAALPKLGDSCPLMSELSEGYQPPAYAAAAAVVMIPKGVASACKNTNGRIDTLVRMVNTGDHYHVAACDKNITLRNKAVVKIVNLPTAWVEAAEETKKPPIHHSQVYFHMARLALDARTTCALKPSSNVDPCNSPPGDAPVARKLPALLRLLIPAAPPPPRYPETIIMPGSTFECSNTQWP